MFDFLLSEVAAVSNNIYSPLTGRFASFNDIFNFITNVIIGVGWGLVFIMLAMGFIRYVMSKGDPKETKAAQETLTYAIIGGIGLFSLMLIKTLVFNLLGVTVDGNKDIGI